MAQPEEKSQSSQDIDRLLLNFKGMAEVTLIRWLNYFDEISDAEDQHGLNAGIIYLIDDIRDFGFDGDISKYEKIIIEKSASAWQFFISHKNKDSNWEHPFDSEYHLEPPTEAPALYSHTLGVKPSEFLLSYYGEWLLDGVLFRPLLRKLDPKLNMALANQFRGRTDELRELLPQKTDELTKKVNDLAGESVDSNERRRIANRLRVAAHRQRAAAPK